MTNHDDGILPQSEPPEPTRKVRADALSRADQAYRLRLLGATWREVSDHLGYADPANCITNVRSVYGTLPEVERDELRAMWRDRADWVLKQALRDVADRRPGAVTAFVRLADLAAKLDGLHAPSEVVLSTPTDRELTQWVEQVLAADPDRRALPEEADILAIEGADPLDGE